MTCWWLATPHTTYSPMAAAQTSAWTTMAAHHTTTCGQTLTWCAEATFALQQDWLCSCLCVAMQAWQTPYEWCCAHHLAAHWVLLECQCLCYITVPCTPAAACLLCIAGHQAGHRGTALTLLHYCCKLYSLQQLPATSCWCHSYM
jgi:hypothetical protein